MSNAQRWKEGTWLVMKNTYERKNAPKGRDRIQIPGYRSDGWVNIKYADGTYDHLTYSLLEKSWGKSPGQNTPLWKVLNG